MHLSNRFRCGDEDDEQQEIQALQHIVGRDQSLLYHILLGWASNEHAKITASWIYLAGRDIHHS